LFSPSKDGAFRRSKAPLQACRRLARDEVTRFHSLPTLIAEV
jgi:hypothetical protein